MQKSRDTEDRFKGNYPEWPLIDRMGSTLPSRLLFGAAYTSFYFIFATHWWMFLLLPIHF